MLEGERAIDLPVGLQAAYAAVAAVDAYPTWQSLIDYVDVLDRDGEGRPWLVSTVLHAGVVKLHLALRYAYEPPHVVRCSLDRGDVRDLHSAWHLDGDGASSRATYHVRVDPGRRLGLLVRGGVADRLRSKVVDETVADLRRHLS